MKTRQVIALLVLSLLVFSNCKKGKDDPFLSLMSRKARISNEWNVSEWSVILNQKNMSQGAINPTSSLERTISDGLYSQQSTGSWGDSQESGTVNSAVWKIEKDNKWSKTISFTSVTASGSTKTTTFKSSGTWYFLGKVDEYKNKERIAFNVLYLSEKEEETNGTLMSLNYDRERTYNDGDLVEVFTITQLKNKETVLERKQWNKRISQIANRETEIEERYKLVKK